MVSKKLNVKKLINSLLLVCFSIILLFCALNITKALADASKIVLNDANITDKSDTVEATIKSFNKDGLVTDVTYHKVNDYVNFKLTLKNNDSQKYTIKDITDNNTYTYVVYEYDKHIGEVIKPNEEKNLEIKVTYKNEVTDMTKRDKANNVEFKILLEDENGQEDEKVIPINPDTSDDLLFYIVFGALSLAGIIIVIKNNSVKKSLLVLLLMVPFATRALTLSYIINVTDNIKLYDKMLVTIDVAGEKQELIVPYNTKIDEPTPVVRPGYNFIGWFENNNEVDFDKEVTKDMNIVAKYNAITYNITYNLDGGSTTNPTTYTVEDTFTLKNPTKKGYTFAGWTGSNGEGLQTRVTVNKGTTGDLNYVAHYSEAEDTPYLVLHKYKNLNSDTYKTEEEHLTGVTNSTVYPQVKHKDGFIDPTVQSLEISPNGDSQIEYYYTRETYTYAFNENVNSTLSAGTYEYETEITVTPKEITGYHFTKWEDNSTNNPRTIKLSENTSVAPQYAPNTDTVYTVIHKYQNLNGGYDEETVSGTGITGTTIPATRNPRTGFVTPDPQNVEILADGTGSVTYTYDRETYNYSFDTETVNSSKIAGSYMYETEITVTPIVAEGYHFTEWNDGTNDNPRTITLTGDMAVSASTAPNTNTAYTVIHRYQNLNDEYDEVSVPGTGTTDTTIPAPLRSQTGFVDPTVQNITITGDGQASVTYTYAREEYAFSITDRTYIDSTSTADGTYMYGTEITAKAIARAGYTFKWNDDNTNLTRTFELTEATTLTPVYTANTDTEYTVIHRYQNLNGGYDEVSVPGTGTTDTTIPAARQPRTGFVTPSEQNITITGDGQASITYTYNRETFSYSFNEYTNSSETAGTYMYGTTITISPVTRAGYTFVKWEDDSTSPSRVITLTSNISVAPVYSANTDTEYTVIHKYQKLDESYTEESVTNTGTTDSTVEAPRQSRTGFVTPDPQNVTITGDGQASVTYVYEREEYSFTADETVISSETSGSYPYETEITVMPAEKQGYHFTEWNDGNTDTPRVITLTGNTSVSATYAPNTDTAYTVIHKYQNLNDGYDEVSVPGTGTTDTTVPAALRLQTGFVTPDPQNITITGDGEASVTYTYDRETYNYSYDQYTDSSVSAGTHMYGTVITVSPVTRPGFTFVKWEDNSTDNPRTITLTSDVTVGTVYEANGDTAYTVIHKYQKLDETYVEESATEYGTTGETVEAPRVPRTGFVTPEIQNVTITGDGQASVTYTYDREKYNYSFDETVNSSKIAGSYMYETEIEVTPNNKAGYTFTEWNDGNTDNPRTITLTGNTSISALYTANTDTAYTVIHRYKKLGSGYDEVSVPGTGTTDTTIPAPLRSQTGFVDPAVQNITITGDGQATVTYIYDRELYSFSFDETVISSEVVGEYPYETEIEVTPAAKQGYHFTNWEDNSTDNPRAITLTSDMEISATYAPNTNTPYTVIHRYLGLDSDYVEIPVPGMGTTDTTITAPRRPQTGFVNPTEQQITITGDGLATVTYIYERESYSFSFDETVVSSVTAGSYPYETEITVTPASRTGYHFTKWEDDSTDNPRTITLTGNMTVSASYAPNTNTPYTVIHRYADLNGGYEEVTVPGTGTTGESIPATLVPRTGFVTPDEQNVEILADGTGSVTYIYSRENYTYAFDSATVNSTLPAGSYPYETEITVTPIVAEGYHFTKWEDDSTTTSRTITLTGNTTVSASTAPNTDTAYTVIHRYQNLDLTYTDVSVPGTGTTDTTIQAPLRSQTGFVDPTEQQITITGDGLATVTYIYDREEYLFSITDRTYIDPTSTADGTYMYGTEITAKAIARAGYTFKWSDDETSLTRTFELTEATTLTPVYTANTDTEYTVIHKYQNLNGGYDEEETTATGTTDTTVPAATQPRTGFITPTTQNITITGDGQATVTYIYDREEYTYSFDSNTTSSEVAGTYMYGTTITVSANTVAGYHFTEWEDGTTTASRIIVLTQNTSVIPSYAPNTDTPYTVNHYKQKLDGTYPSVADNTDSLTGTTEATVTPATRSYTGFTAPSTQTKQIMGDGTTTFNYYYTRNKYSLTITNAEYVQEGDISDDYYYEEQITLTALPKTGHTFTGWSNGESTNQITITMGTTPIIVGPEYAINSYTITFDTRGGLPQPSARTVTYNNQVGTLPDNVTKTGFTFAGWYDDPDSGTLITASTLVTQDDIYYAHWDEELIPDVVCKKATTLHTETCNQTDSSKYCSGAGYAVGATITYGNIIRSDTYAPGDAFDCNVDGTGYNQRFYYIRTLDNKAVLINNLNYRERTETNPTGQEDQDDYAGKYSVAHDNLPKTSEWTNLPITFDNRAARLISKDDIITMTNAQSVSSLSPTGSLDNYNFLFENSNYSGIHQRSAQWVEQESDTERYRYRNDQRNFIALKSTELNTSQNTVRPVIEVPLAAIEDAYVVKFDAMGGTLSNEYVRVIKTESLGKLPTPQHTGWVLLGWFDSDQFTTQISGSHVPVGYETYYAKYVKSIEFAELTYDEYELEVNETDTITFEDSTDLEPVTFASSDPTVVTVDASGNITGQSSGTATITITGTVTGVTRTVPVTVDEVSAYYHIIFDVDGGEPVAEMDVLKDTAIGPLPTTTKTDYRLIGWFTNTNYDVQVTPETIITRSMTIHAKWVPSDAVAELNGNLYYNTLQAAIDAAPTTKSTIKLLSNVEVTKPIDMVNNNTDKDIILDLNGYTLSTASSAIPKTNVIKTKAHLEVKNGTISSAKNDALIDVEGTNSQLILRENITLIATGGRACVYNTGGNVLIDGNASLTSNAEWTSSMKRGTVQTLTNGNTVIKSGTIINNRSSYSYGVYVQQGTVTIGTKDGIYDTENLIVQGETNGICAEVNYSLYDGLVKGKTAAVNDETKIANTEDDMNKINDEVDGYKRLYYESVISKYKVTIEAYGGTGNPEFITIDAGDPVTSSDIVTPTKGVYTFGGWYYDDEFQNPVTFPFTPSGNMTIYAEWSYDASDVPVPFDMTSDAIADYYDNIDTWKTQVSVSGTKSKPDASDYTEILDTTNFKTSMRTNFDAHNCSFCKASADATTWNDNQNNCNYSSPGEFCDKSKGYDTGVTDGVNVYEYNTSTQEATLVSYTTSDDGVIYNMIPGKTYKWESPSDSNVYGYVTASAVNNKRTIHSSVRNVRDLGGMEVSFTRGNTTKTGTIKYGKLFRGAQLSGGQTDVNSITTLGVTKEVDLRDSEDGKNQAKLPSYDKCDSNCSTLSESDDIDITNYLIYPNFENGVNYDALRDAMVYVMQKVVDGENIYFHCTIGTDRTGTLAYFLEGLLGVGEEEKLEDYELSYFFGLLNRHRYHDNLAGSQINPRFLSMYKTYDTNEKIYNWFMLESSDTESNHPDKDLIEAFRDAMIDYD